MLYILAFTHILLSFYMLRGIWRCICIVRLFQLRAMRRPSSGGMGKEESHVSHFVEG